MNTYLKSEQNVNKQCWAEKKVNTPKLANPRLFFEEIYAFLSLKFAFILISGLFFKELCTCFSKKFTLFCRWNLRLFCVFQGNLHLFSMEFVLTFQRTLHLFRRWNLHVFFDEIRASFRRVEICVSFSMNFSLVFWWNFHLWVSRNFGFWRLYTKICEIWGWTQVWKWRE